MLSILSMLSAAAVRRAEERLNRALPLPLAARGGLHVSASGMSDRGRIVRGAKFGVTFARLRASCSPAMLQWVVMTPLRMATLATRGYLAM